MIRHGLLHHNLARFIRRWHARLGLTAAVFFIVLVITGVALNHTERLGLAHTAIQSDTLNGWYGLPPPSILAAYPDAAFVATPEAWLYNGRRLAEGGGAVVGVAALPDMLAVATTQSLGLYARSGERIDTLRGSALPQLPLTALGHTGNMLVIKTPSGIFSSSDGLAWHSLQDENVAWAQNRLPDARLRAQISERLSPSLPLERIMLDLHSGRLLGVYGPYFMDTAAVILLILSLSGTWIQWRSWRQRRRHPHKS
ncbi:MAG: hypothetical protein ACYC4K_00685 [Thiobacillus sp.]